jgi:hypothetical protein
MWRLFLFGIVAAVNAGCLDQIIPEHQTMEEAGVRQMLVQRGFQATGYVQVGRAGFDSTLEPNANVTMFVSQSAAAAYAAVSPESETTSGPSFPVGGVIVRYPTDAANHPTGLTVMVKREVGYFPEAGDFFFGVTDLQGNPVNGEDGVEWGALPSCGSCHHTRAGAGFLFGVPETDR